MNSPGDIPSGVSMVLRLIKEQRERPGLGILPAVKPVIPRAGPAMTADEMGAQVDG
jgi:hypothetical protein